MADAKATAPAASAAAASAATTGAASVAAAAAPSAAATTPTFLDSVGFAGKKPVTAVESKDGRIISKIKKAMDEKRPFYSFEYFPPKTDDGVTNLYARVDRMAALQPMFMDVTWGAGGSTADLTLEISSNIQNYCSAEVMMHLTCTNMPLAKVREALVTAKERGIRNILALRGDPPKGAETWEQCADGFAYAVDLVKFIRQEFGDYFGIAVAGYPEGHISCTSLDDDLKHLKAKMDAGADFVVTQLFYDVNLFLDFVKRARAIGITQPIIPGIMPIQNYNGFLRMTGFCKTFVPPAILEALEPIKHDDARIKQYGIELGVQMCKQLLAAGVPGLHFYTLNLERSVVRILAGLGFVQTQHHTPMPWQKSKLQHRANESVRPVFWKHRPQSYLTRTTTWDEFPNGRWGDARSPAFGDLADYHLCGFKTGKASERVSIWGSPTKTDDIVDVFVNYLEGKVPRLPWCENQPSPETLSMKDKLVAINRLGFLTINSQPRVNGAPSTDACVGWGAPGGVVYQKAYLEFFASPQNLEKFMAQAKHFPMLTYHAINNKGDAFTNVTAEKRVNAVTWGVWPTSEILQPTVVDPVSFEVWKEEAYALFQSQWISAYAKGSASAKFLSEVQATYFLVNVVDNDFLAGDIFAVFDLLADPSKQPPPPNKFFADQVPRHQDSDDEHY